MLRKFTYLTEYPEIQEIQTTRPKFMRDHLGMFWSFCQIRISANSYPLADHCIEMIRQNLMCVADVGIISWVLPIAQRWEPRIYDKLIRYDWVSGWEVPFPDFNTYHKCRNFDTILDWTTSHRVRIPKDHMQREGHEFNLLEPPQWRRLFPGNEKRVVRFFECQRYIMHDL